MRVWFSNHDMTPGKIVVVAIWASDAINLIASNFGLNVEQVLNMRFVVLSKNPSKNSLRIIPVEEFSTNPKLNKTILVPLDDSSLIPVGKY